MFHIYVLKYWLMMSDLKVPNTLRPRTLDISISYLSIHLIIDLIFGIFTITSRLFIL